MNVIKSILLVIFMIGGLAMSAQNIITSTQANVTIDHTTTRESLVQLRTELLAQGIDFRYMPKFDNQRQITSISFTITANDGAITGSGEHHALKNPNASLSFILNKTAGTFTVNSIGE